MGKGGVLSIPLAWLLSLGLQHLNLLVRATDNVVECRYGVKRSSIGDVSRIGDCTCQGPHQSQCSMPWTIEYTSSTELFGYT